MTMNSRVIHSGVISHFMNANPVMQPYVLFVNHPKSRDMKIKKSGNIKKKSLEGK